MHDFIIFNTKISVKSDLMLFNTGKNHHQLVKFIPSCEKVLKNVSKPILKAAVYTFYNKK